MAVCAAADVVILAPKVDVGPDSVGSLVPDLQPPHVDVTRQNTAEFQQGAVNTKGGLRCVQFFVFF